MCGIAGIVAAGESSATGQAVTDAQAHRGPDGQGCWRAGGVWLGHRRLAILDLSEAAGQPMRSRDGRYAMVFNGEIFNYRELREQLAGPFRSTGDTEVLLEACAAWGVEPTLNRLNGMFAFALWDGEQNELTLARDRSGEKPVVYFEDGQTFAFASELKALAPLHSFQLDPQAVDAFLGLGYVPAPLAIFRNCRKLAAGHLLRFRRGQTQIRRWWFPERATPASGVGSTARLRELLSGAVALRLRADVPVALALSGGVDSSILAAECAHLGRKPEAFTVVFDGDETELRQARGAARHLGLRHHAIPVQSVAAACQLAEMARHYDEPFADSSALGALALARAIRGQGFKVVLTGDGGDEAFAGYPHYEHVAAKQLLKAAAAAAGVVDGSGSTGVYVESKSVFRRRARAALLGVRECGGSLAGLLSADAFLGQASGDTLHQALWRDRHLYLPNDLTFKMDIALSAFSVEGRAPFLDHRILEWSQTLDSSQLVRGSRKKILLREAYRDQLPEGLLERPKRGFGSPIGAWLKGPLKPRIDQLIPCPLLGVGAQQNCSGQRLWTLASFAQWAQTWNAKW